MSGVETQDLEAGKEMAPVRMWNGGCYLTLVLKSAFMKGDFVNEINCRRVILTIICVAKTAVIPTLVVG